MSSDTRSFHHNATQRKRFPINKNVPKKVGLPSAFRKQLEQYSIFAARCYA